MNKTEEIIDRFDKLRHSTGSTKTGEIRTSMQSIMQKNCAVFRNHELISRGIEEFQKIENSLDNSSGGECSDGISGDFNQDGVLDVIDLVMMVDVILGASNASDSQIQAGDVSGDGLMDVIDVVMIVDIILSQ